jgi:tetratricopeptide (TPR) repeat protein
MRRVWLAPVLLSVACASTPIKKTDVAALAEADALVLQGCYDCLLEARATYARVGVGKARPLVVARLFETDVLITLREKELALDSSRSFGEAQALGKELPPAFDAARVLAIVEAVPGDDLGWTHRETADFRRAHVPFVPKINDELQWLATSALGPAVRQYVSLAIDCAYPTRARPGGQMRMTRPEVPDGAPPLVAYRTGICLDVASPILAKVRDEVPRFVETGFFMSRRALLAFKTEGGYGARVWLDENYKRFPDSPAVTFISGNFNQLVGDCKAGLRFYEETLTRKPEHELALIGRTICLTFLKRTDDAIAEATHMIELKTDNIDEAYYWRSWNHYSRQELDLARADINLAKSRRATASIYTLAGMIEHDQNDLNEAEIDLKSARDMSSQNCTAMWYLGLVALKREQWLVSGKNFEDAMGCYDENVKDSETGLRAMANRTDIDPQFRAHQIEGFEAAIKEDRSHQYAAAFNAANQYAHGGNVDKARTLLEIASLDPALSKQVADLRRIIGGQ